jgi:glycosyltransferase involved in cell wall biosynthesis
MELQKTKIAYFGNKQELKKNTKTVMETLIPLWSDFCEIKSFSSHNNKALKMLDFVFHFFKDGLRANKIVMDVYSTSAFYFAFILSFLSIVFNKKYILFLHGGNLPNRQKRNPKSVAFIFSRAYKIVAPSYYLKNYFEEKGFLVEYIPNSIEISKYSFTERKIARPKILSIRGFGKPYNPLMTLKAMAIVVKKLPDVELCMLGNKGEYYYEEALQFIQENKLEKNVQILPKMTQVEWVALSTQYDIMVSNPEIDNTPVSILEGLALGMCVVSTNVGGVPFLVTHQKNALLVENNDEQNLANHIEALCNQPALANLLSTNARAKATEFNWESIKPTWMNLLVE